MTRVVPLSLVSLSLLAGCHDRSLKICDITQSGCQEGIYYADLRIRGDGYDPFAGIPPIRTITEDQYRSELEAQAANSPQPAMPWWDATLSLLKLLPSTGDIQSTSIDNQVQNTAAYYSPETRKVTVVSHPSQGADEKALLMNMDTLAHELVHALQDRELNLKASAKTTDRDFAMRALIEGDAALYDYLFLREALPPGFSLTHPDPLDYFTYWRDTDLSDDPNVEGNFASLGPPFLAAYWMVYPLGGIWLADRWDKGGNAAVRHAYGQAPLRSLDFLLPPGSAPPPGKDIPCPPALPNGFTALSRDTFGAIDLFAYLMAWGVPSNDSLAGARLWLNDSIYVSYNSKTQKTAVAWRFELASPLADSVIAQIATVGGPRVLQDGSTLLVTASDDATLMATWNPSTACPSR